jgi:hypothetical protein
LFVLLPVEPVDPVAPGVPLLYVPVPLPLVPLVLPELVEPLFDIEPVLPDVLPVVPDVLLPVLLPVLPLLPVVLVVPCVPPEPSPGVVLRPVVLLVDEFELRVLLGVVLSRVVGDVVLGLVPCVVLSEVEASEPVRPWPGLPPEDCAMATPPATARQAAVAVARRLKDLFI